jgi:plasmid replication initiation protein
MTKKVAPTPKDVVVQGNRFNLARYDLTAIQKKLVGMVYSKVRQEDDDLHEYEFDRRDIAKLLRREADDNYAWLKSECKRLLKQVAELPNPEDPNGWILSTFFSTIEYTPKTGAVRFQPAPKMKPYFLNLQREYTLIPLPYFMAIGGKYALRLLDLVMQWWTLIERKGTHTFEIELDELKTAWKLPKTFHEPKYLRSRLMVPAILELNAARLGFTIEAVMDRDGVRGSARCFHFTVTRLKEADPIPVDPPTVEDETVKSLSPDRRVLFDAILKEIQAEGELIPKAGYSSDFMLQLAQKAEALERLKKRHPVKKARKSGGSK